MEPIAMTNLSRTLTLATAGALALALAACDSKPAADNPGKTFNSLVENAGRNLEPAAPAAGAKGADSSNMSTDAALAARVKAALSTDPGLRSITVDVNAANGVITLYGTADTPAKSRQAAMVALNVDGVRSVRNEMVIVRGS
jgi:osmotically-inducible protein OsmY